MHSETWHSILWEKHEISMSIMVLAARQPETEWDLAVGERFKWKRAVRVIFFPSFLSFIFRIYHGRVVEMPGTRNAVTPTTALQTPGTWPAPWWSSGSKRWMNLWFEAGTLPRGKRVEVSQQEKKELHQGNQGQQPKWPFLAPFVPVGPLEALTAAMPFVVIIVVQP